MALGPQDEPLEPRRDVERLARIAKEPKLAIDYVARSASPPAGTGELLRAAVIGVPSRRTTTKSRLAANHIYPILAVPVQPLAPPSGHAQSSLTGRAGGFSELWSKVGDGMKG